MTRSNLTRFAPTPSGLLHWGNAYSFVTTWLVAKKRRARILLRIDDLDFARKRPEYVEDVFRCLEWLGLAYDEGPMGPDDFEANYSQRHRLDLYRNALEELRDAGRLFACVCSRASVRKTLDGLHPASCRSSNRSLDEECIAWRMSTNLETERWHDLDGTRHDVDLHRVMRDFVVRRKDTVPAYQLAFVVDDTHFGVDLIVRGQDLIESSAAQRWLSRQLSGSTFTDAQFVHHPIVSGEDGIKLSKSAGATSLMAMREENDSPARLFQMLSPLLGLPEPVDSLDQVLEVWLEQN